MTSRRRRLRDAGLGLLFALAIAVAGWQLSRATTFQVFGGIHARVDTSRPLVAITFDDGPSVRNTPPVLDVLRRHGARATFFMTGENLARHQDIAVSVAADGHEGANHSYSHRRMVFVSPSFVREEIENTERLLRGAGFAGDLLFRPPYAKKLFVLPYVMREMGRKTITWDVESHDTETQDAAVLSSNVLDNVRPGSIVLFHDGGPPKLGTIEALDRVLSELRSRGFELVTVSQLLAAAN